VPGKLESEISSWLETGSLQCNSTPCNRVAGIIAPHAGFSYSGSTAAFAYSKVDPKSIRTVFILGPSHHYFLKGCAVTNATEYATPLGNIPIDRDVTMEVKRLLGDDLCETMDQSIDEEEHSIEMQLPFVAHFLKRNSEIKLVPLLIGSLSPEVEERVGLTLSHYVARKDVLFIVSSDFCHWGSRFRFQYYNPDDGPIFESIQKLDKLGMDTIEARDPDAFTSYLRKYKNTICGRHPINVFLHASRTFPFKIQFVKYAQSSSCQSMRDSSVSYAAAIVTE